MNQVHAVRRRRVSVAAALLAAGALFVSPAVRAEFPFPPTPRELHHEVRGLVHDVLHTLDRIPMEIHRDLAGNLGTFLVGNAYYGPHRHYHATYSFPVWIDGGVVYRPYTYCNDRLYGSYASRPQFWSGWGEPSQGRWCSHHHAYYPTGHSCFHPHYGGQYGAQYGPGYDSGYRPGYGSGYDPGYRPQYRPEYRQEYRQEYRPRYNSHRGSGNGSHGRRGGDHRHDRNCHHDRDYDRR